MRIAAAVLVVLMIAACSSEPGSEPPPYRDGTTSVFWSSDEPAGPSAAWLDEAMAQHAVTTVLVPSDPSGAEPARITLRIGHEGSHSFFEVGTTGGGIPPLRVSAARGDPGEPCEPPGIEVRVRDTMGCLAGDGTTSVVLTWSERWIHRARWTQAADVAVDHHLAAIVAWLDTWAAHPR